MHKIKEKLMKELEEYEKKGDISMSSLDVIHKITDTIKNIDKIEMLEDEGGYSERGYGRGGMWSAEGSYRGGRSYDDGSSYARRGTHYVRGHYSRDNDDYSEDYSQRGDYGRRYSREDGKDFMMKKIDEMLGEAKTPAEREALKECIKVIERA